jgi:hypothetical protein
MEDVALPDDLLRNALNSSHPAAFAALTAAAEARRAARQEFLSLPKKFLLASDVPGDGVVLREAPHLEVKPPLYRKVKRGAGQFDRDGGQSQGVNNGLEAGPGSRKRPATPAMDGVPAYKRLQLMSTEALLPALGDDLVPPSDPVSDMLRAILAARVDEEELEAADTAEMRSPGAMAAVVAQAQQLLTAVSKADALGQELLAIDKVRWAQHMRLLYPWTLLCHCSFDIPCDSCMSHTPHALPCNHRPTLGSGGKGSVVLPTGTQVRPYAQLPAALPCVSRSACCTPFVPHSAHCPACCTLTAAGRLPGAHSACCSPRPPPTGAVRGCSAAPRVGGARQA